MDLPSFFKKKKAPKNIGEMVGYHSDGTVNKYYLSFPGSAGAPTYELKETLSVGSQVGDVILPEAAISPRHCTFSINQEVVSLLDHGSNEGTFVGNKQIPSGRMIILRENDEITLGEVEVKLIIECEEVVEESIDTSPFQGQTLSKANIGHMGESGMPKSKTSLEAPELEIGLEVDTQLIQRASEQVEEEDKTQDIDDELIKQLAKEQKEEEEPVPQKNAKGFGKKVKLKKNKKVKARQESVDAASSLLRAMAVINEVFICGILYILATGNQDIISILDGLPSDAWSLIAPLYDSQLAPVLNEFLKDYPFLIEFGKDLSSVFEGDNRPIVHLVTLFVLLRLLSTLVFGVSLGQWMIGLASSGNIVAKRLLGLLREGIGLFTGPLLLCDLPSLVSKRTVKEIITFTCVETNSLIRSLILAPLTMVIMIALFFMAPIFQGAQLRVGMPITKEKYTKLDSREDTGVMAEGLGISLPTSNKFVMGTRFDFKLIEGKKTASAVLLVDFSSEKGDLIEISRVKQFDMKEMIKKAFKLNFMAKEKFSELSKYAYSVGSKNSNLKTTGINPLLFAEQFSDLLQASFLLDLNHLEAHIENYGPFLKSFVDFRDQIEHMIEKPISSVSIKQIGDTYGALFEFSTIGQRKSLRFMPFLPTQGRIIELTSIGRRFPWELFAEISPEIRWNKSANSRKNIVDLSVHPLNDIDVMLGLLSVEKLDHYQKMMILNFAVHLLEELQGRETEMEWGKNLRSYIQLIDLHYMQSDIHSKRWSSTYQAFIDLQKAFSDRDISHLERVIKKHGEN